MVLENVKQNGLGLLGVIVSSMAPLIDVLSNIGQVVAWLLGVVLVLYTIHNKRIVNKKERISTIREKMALEREKMELEKLKREMNNEDKNNSNFDD